MSRIALVEDHERMAALICKAINGAGMPVDVFTTIDSAWHGILRGAYSAIVVDRGLPDGDGLDLVRRLRARDNAVPCLMVTARDALHDRVHGLESGADDYLPKPFSMEELVARLRALMRRPVRIEPLEPAHAGVRVDPAAASMSYQGREAVLAPAEIELMLTLVKAAGATVRRSALELAGWGLGEAVTPNALDVALHRLRRKLASIGSPVLIVNLRGRGYALRASDEEP